MKVMVISPKNRTTYNFRGDLIKKIISAGNEVVVTGPDTENLEKIMDLGAKFIEVPMKKNGVNPFEDLKYENKLYKIFKKEKPDVVFGYTSKPVIYGSIAAKRAGVSHIVAMVTGAGYAFTAETFKAKVIKFIMSVLYKTAFMCADKAIFQNRDDKEQFVKEGLVRETKCCIVNGSGVNCEKFTPTDYPEKTTFFMLSRVMYSKGIREYLEACSVIKKKYPDVRCMLLGACENIQDSISREELDVYINKGIIEYFGETDCVENYYKQCSVYVLPSYREGTPRTVLEAMAMARPVITTDAPGCRETVKDGENGYLVSVKDVRDLAEKMEFFINNPASIEKMGKKSLELCMKKFDVNIVNDDMCKYLNII